MNLSDVVDSYQILEATFADKKLRVTPRTKKLPVIDDALKVVEKQIELAFVASIVAGLAPALTATVANYEQVNGAYDVTEDQYAWTAGLDDQVEAVIENYVPFLSADWLGSNLDDTGVQLEDGVNTFCKNLGKEFYKQQTYGKKPGQVLSSAGITTGEVEKWLEEHIAAGRGSTATADEDEAALQSIMVKIKSYIGASYDVMEVYEDLDLASDEDQILAEGAAPRLGLEAEEVIVLQNARLEHGNKVADFLFEQLEKADTEEEKPKSKKKGKAKAKAEESFEEVEGFSTEPLRALKESGGAKDTEMAKLLGVSRATYNNWLKKDVVELEAEQIEIVKSEVLARAQRLNEALNILGHDA